MELGNFIYYVLFYLYLYYVIEVGELVLLVDFVKIIKGVSKWMFFGCNLKSGKMFEKKII